MTSELPDNAADSPESSRPRTSATASSSSSKARNYFPLAVAMLVATLIVVSILPSALNLPQSNPSTVLEYAPVPPESDTPPPPSGGGIGSLGLASSSSLTSAPPLPAPTAAKKAPPITAQKKCIRGRQTEDPNSPPCVSFFEGDNGGSTWQGVTKDEVVGLVYQTVIRTIDQQQGTVETTPSNGTYCDVDNLDCDGDGEQDDAVHVWVRIGNAFTRYFNTRYQTYNRHVRFYMYFSSVSTAAGRRGDAQDNWETVKPFAVLNQIASGGFGKEYNDAMAARGISVFGGYVPEPRAYHNKPSNKSKVWNYWPDSENWADGFVDYICTKAPPGSVVSRGPFSGQTRKYAFYWTTDAGYPNLRYFKDLAQTGMKERCGITGPDFTYSLNQFWFWNSRRAGDQSEAQTNAANMRQQGINTVVWLGGAETYLTEALKNVAHFPEFIIAADGHMDGQGFARRNDQTVLNNAWVFSFMLREDDRERSPSYQAYKEAEPDGRDYRWASTQYRDWVTMFTAIQVAGPKLSPRSVDSGLHAIQSRQSTNPYIAAYFFHPGDYSGVKDAHEAYWDSQAKDPDGSDGCYRMVREGLRYLAGQWSQTKGAGLDVRGYAAKDPCNGYGGQGTVFQPA